LHYELVDIERAPRGLLRVFIDRMPGHDYANPLRGDTAPDTGQYITVDDCEKVTRQLQYVLEVEGLDYARLEVSSPGLDRPLRSESDLDRFSGQVVNLTLKLPFQGRKNWRGLVSRAEGGEGWNLRLTDGAADTALGFTWNEVREARLVPVLDFKGRKPRDGGGAEVAAAPSALTTDGG
jgi:ribosome maturation factor RimP